MQKTRFMAAFLLALLLGMGTALAQDNDGQQTPAPDNTKVNKRDRDRSEPTADQQKENRSDRELTREIRRAVVKDKSLSSYAHNVKIITQDGNVILKGPVRSEEEKQTVEAKATEVAGQGKVTNQIRVAPDKKHRKQSDATQ